MISLAENQSCHRSKTSSCLSAPLTHSRSHSHHLLALSSPSLSSLLPVKAHNVTPSAADERNQPTTSRGTTMTTEKTVALNHERNGDGRFPLCPMNDALFAFAIASYQFRRNERAEEGARAVGTVAPYLQQQSVVRQQGDSTNLCTVASLAGTARFNTPCTVGQCVSWIWPVNDQAAAEVKAAGRGGGQSVRQAASASAHIRTTWCLSPAHE